MFVLKNMQKRITLHRETVTYRSIMLRENNIDWLNKANKKTEITVTRLINAAIKDFLDNLK